jgi:ubiquilin
MSESSEAMGLPSGSSMKLTIKTPKEKQEIEVPADATVETLKEEVSRKFNASKDQLCLIFAGKVMKDPDTLESEGIKDGATLHLVIKAPAPSAPDVPIGRRPPADVNASPFGLGPLGGLAGIGSLGMGSTDFVNMQQRMQTMVRS